jgi:hypothetical protein
MPPLLSGGNNAERIKMNNLDWKISTHDRDILLGLAHRVRAIADSPRNREIVRQWYRHDENKAERPLILTETDGGLQLVVPNFKLQCHETWAQEQENTLLRALIHAEVIQDDCPVDPFVDIHWQLKISDYGIPFHETKPADTGVRGAVHIDAVITDLEKDFHKLKLRTFHVNREASLATKRFLEDFYDGVLGVRFRGHPWWTLGLTMTAINFIGLESLMISMYDQPEALHRLMAFLRDDHLALLQWLEQEGLLNLNNESDYIGSGSRGYTRALPHPDWIPGTPVRQQDIWGLLESQETVGVGPDQYEEFIFQYENAIAKKLGRVYYGCCEPVHTRWHVLQKMANLKRVSISPWCDQSFMAREMGDHYGFSRKPNPSQVSTTVFDESLIRKDLSETMQLAKAHGCSLEIAMKDIHTLNNEPDRLTRWVQIARETSSVIFRS